jgi:Tfp pilus assembly protein PilN
MTQVNLLPSDVRERQKTRRTFLAAVAGAAGVVVLLLLVYLVQVSRLSAANHDLATQQAVNSQIQTNISKLQPFADLKAQVADRQALVDGLLQGEILWSGVLHDTSMVMPGQVWLTGMSGTLSATPSAPSAPSSSGTSSSSSAPGSTELVGSIQFQGVAFNQPAVALWLKRMVQVNGWVNSWVSQAATTQIGDTDVIQFSSSVDLTSDATTNGGSK